MAKLQFKDVKIGDQLKIKNGNWAHYGAPQGSIVTITGLYNAQSITCLTSTGQSVNINIGSLERTVLTAADIEIKVKEFTAKAKDFQAKLDWMKGLNVDEFNETEFKVWTTLETLDDKKMSNVDKMRIVAQLIDGGSK